jgi:hypothetical protein
MVVADMSMAALPPWLPRQPVLLYRRGALVAASFSLLSRRGAARQRQLSFLPSRRGSGCIFGKFCFIFIGKTYND